MPAPTITPIHSFNGYFTVTISGVETELGGVMDISFPKMKAKKLMKSHLRMANPFEESGPGLIDPGEIDLKMICDKVQLTTIYTLFAARLLAGYTMKIYFGNGVSTITGNGWFAEPGFPDGTEDDYYRGTCKIQCSGKWTYAQ